MPALFPHAGDRGLRSSRFIPPPLPEAAGCGGAKTGGGRERRALLRDPCRQRTNEGPAEESERSAHQNRPADRRFAIEDAEEAKGHRRTRSSTEPSLPPTGTLAAERHGGKMAGRLASTSQPASGSAIFRLPARPTSACPHRWRHHW